MKENTFVDNAMGLVSTEEEAKKFKGKCSLGKWESKIETLNDDKERVKTILLGVGWNKKDDTFEVEIEINVTATISMRTMLKTLASIYDPLGLMSPILVEAKHLFGLAVDAKKRLGQ